MILSIDTSDAETARLVLKAKQFKVYHEFGSQDLSERLIVEIKKFLKEQKVSFQKISKVEVIPGLGHFSKIRTGVAVANALAFGLGIKHELVRPYYDKLPNITFGKKKI